jgi:PKD repeat protein
LESKANTSLLKYQKTNFLFHQHTKAFFMKRIAKIMRVVSFLFIIALAFFASPMVHAFQEGWESSPIGPYTPTSHDTLPLLLIQGDEGDWLLGDTVSEDPDECGSTPHTAEIFSSGGNRSLRLTSNDSRSSCADNVWVNLFEIPPLDLNSGFDVPLSAGTIISFDETGNLSNPQTGSPYCVNPPCGDTVSLTLEDNRGNLLSYILQRASAAVPNTVRSSYREIFLDPNAGSFSRNLFADFSTIPNFNPTGVSIKTVAFEVSDHGSATIDNICIGTSGCVPPPLISVPDVVGLTQSDAEAAIADANLSVGTVNWQISTTVPSGSVISQTPGAGAEVTLGTNVYLIISSGVPSTSVNFYAYPKSGVAPLSVTFVEATGNVTSWQWSFGDGTGSDVQNPSHTYTRAGTYSVSLTGAGPYGSDSEVKTDYISVGIPNANEFKIIPSDGGGGDYFGQSVAISGNYAIGGAAYAGENGTGAAYIFENRGSSWNEVAKLTASGGGTLDFFGRSVSISDGYTIVGAPGNLSGTGTAYIFEKSGSSWNQVAKLTASDSYTGDGFGSGVSISGGYAIVGAPGRYLFSYGAAYIFEKNDSSWNQVAKLTASEPAVYDYFGQTVSISGDSAIVGAYGYGYGVGAAYIFEKNGNSWSQAAKLTASGGGGGLNFGQSVSLSGNYAITGAYGDDKNGSSSGAAYIFEKSGNNWNQVAELTASDGAAGDYFSYHGVAISGGLVIVGAYGDDDNGAYSGAAYIFERSGNSWHQIAKLTAGGGVANDNFGYGVSISGEYAMVGASQEDYNGAYSGAASIFGLSISNHIYGDVAMPWIPLLLLGE